MPSAAPNMASGYHSPFTLLSISIVLLPVLVSAVNVSTIFSTQPDFSDFGTLLSDPSIAADLANRTSITILAVSNPIIGPLLLSSSNLKQFQSFLPYIVRYHILLEYISASDLQEIPIDGKIVVTLLQTTGRANFNHGNVNLTRDVDGNITIHSLSPVTESKARLLNPIRSLPYNLSVFSIDSLLCPDGFSIYASASAVEAPVNLTRVLLDGKRFNIALSMLLASGVMEELEGEEWGAGLTLFVPTDDAFFELPRKYDLQHLSAATKSVILKLHVLHSYYPLGSLQSIVNPVQPTLATEAKGAGTYTLSITKVHGLVAIDTGIVQAEITQTVFDENPVAVFGISNVLLPKEMFGNVPAREEPPPAAPPEIYLAPQGSIRDPTALLATPPNYVADQRSSSGNGGCRRFLLLIFSVIIIVFM